jgi:FkbM family methyltransferase
MLLKEIAKKIRGSQPLNRITTDSLKLLLGNGAFSNDFLIRYLPRFGEVKSALPDGAPMRLWSEGDEQVTNYIFWKGWKALEPETKRLFYSLARESRVIFDIGAHIGSYAILAAVANRNARVFAFEPMPIVYERLIRNAALNDLPNLTCRNVAAGTHSHEADFYHAVQGVPSSSSLSLEFMSRTGAPIQSTKVKVIALDEFIAEHQLPSLDLIKMDTEETEPDVLQGMIHSLRKFRPKIISEVLRTENVELESILGPLGYCYYRITDSGLKPMPSIRAEGPRDNFLFLPKPEREIESVPSP